MSSFCYAMLPRAGLGNMLLVWARAKVFADLNTIPLFLSGWNRFKVGPYLRRESNRRNYRGYFNDSTSVNRLTRILVLIKSRRVYEPPLELLSEHRSADLRNILYVFDRMPHWVDLFGDLKPHRELIINCIHLMLKSSILSQLSLYAPPCIGVHVRLGDFRRLGVGEDFARVGGVRTPQHYFVNAIQKIRDIRGECLPATVFSDGKDSELQELLQLPAVHRSAINADIVDLLLLSKSKVILTSAGSTFSYWSAFLSKAAVIRHPDHIHAALRPDSTNRYAYEGPMQDSDRTVNPLLVENIRAIGLPFG